MINSLSRPVRERAADGTMRAAQGLRRDGSIKNEKA